MTSKVLFLVSPESQHNDNHERLPAIFRRHGWLVDCIAHEAMCWHAQAVYCGNKPAADYTLIWPIGLGPRRSFLDRMTLLRLIDQKQLINNTDVYLNLHGKTAWLDKAPPTIIAADVETLTNGFMQAPGAWILKPLAGSFGHQVHKVHNPEQIHNIVDKTPSQYWMLQEYVPAIVEGETRTLICANKVIGSYLRIPNNNLHANLAANARAVPTELKPADADLVAALLQQLTQAGAGYAAIDTVGGYLMEVNIANPGGLGTLSELYDSEAIDQRLMEAINQDFAS